MFRQTICVVPLVLALLATFNCETSMGARLIKIRVYVDGQVILEGSMSDDGSRDADEVWRLLEQGSKEKKKWAALRETEHFDAAALKPDGGNESRFHLHVLGDRQITLSVAFGGKAYVSDLILYRVATEHQDHARKPTFGRTSRDKPPKKWMLDAQQIGDLFSRRLISRREAARLKNPKQLE
ncbi:MAG: hypothetical protein KatS3mg111_4374 [Pirellulaceae bacterium]|nr:MAG: hypothetical protein KatS3mg111_4374 [Pirellulaceae bacterium]